MDCHDIEKYGDGHEFARFGDLVGKTLVDMKVVKDVVGESDHIVFTCDDGDVFVMCHLQDCCENVFIEEITDKPELILVGPEILEAQEEGNHGESVMGTCTWTFYKLATRYGWVDIRWYGMSNGHYSEHVHLVKLKKRKED